MRPRSPQDRRLRNGVSPRGVSVLAVLGVSAVLGSLAVTGCTSKGGQNPGAQSAERQSDTEYDLARDLLEKDNPRAALDHAMKAISLNADNEKAQYFVAVIYLKFCSTNRGLAAT